MFRNALMLMIERVAQAARDAVAQVSVATTIRATVLLAFQYRASAMLEPCALSKGSVLIGVTLGDDEKDLKDLVRKTLKDTGAMKVAHA